MLEVVEEEEGRGKGKGGGGEKRERVRGSWLRFFLNGEEVGSGPAFENVFAGSFLFFKFLFLSEFSSYF